MNRRFLLLIAGLLGGLMLAACGGSASDPLNTGVFIDSAVEGLEFQSGNRFGATDAEGKFFQTFHQNLNRKIEIIAQILLNFLQKTGRLTSKN